jgi:peptidylprolyl isomerase
MGDVTADGVTITTGRQSRRRLLLALPAISAAVAMLSACGSPAASVPKTANEQQAAQKPADAKPAAPAKPADAKPADAKPAAAAPKAAGKQWPAPPAMTIDSNKSYTGTLKTSLGDMKFELYAKDAPNTVNNFVFLAKEGFYEGVIFHRIINGFMVQTGDPTGTGGGGPGYRFNDELNGPQTYTKGTLAMANAGPNTQGSQFFICHGPQAETLPKRYTIFGKVTDGIDVLDKIAGVPVQRSPSGENSKPTNPPSIVGIQIADA